MCKILSLDGGGSWAMLQLLTLSDRYPGLTGHQILRQYDLVVANSGGSIVLACMAEDWTPEFALGLFRDKGKREQIFSRNSFSERFFPGDYFPGFGPKYSSRRKGLAFRKIFRKGDRFMDEIPAMVGKPELRLVICTYDALNNRAKFFKSHGKGQSFDRVRLTQAIHGSSNAPIQYFDFPARFKAKGTEIWYDLWDGALGGFNNPVVAGIIEAIKCGYKKDTISVVALGTSNRYMSVPAKGHFYKLKQIAIRERRKKYLLWRLKYQLAFFKLSILNQAKTILYEPPDWANYVGFMFLFGEGYTESEFSLERFIRLSPVLHIDSNTPAEVRELQDRLYGLDMNLTRDEDIRLVEDCYEFWKKGLIPNQTIEYQITRENDLVNTIGHPTWEAAFRDWRQWL